MLIVLVSDVGPHLDRGRRLPGDDGDAMATDVSAVAAASAVADILEPYLFEVAWEAANKGRRVAPLPGGRLRQDGCSPAGRVATTLANPPAVGGIYTVLKTKAQVTVDEYGGRYCLLGPISHSSQLEVEEQEPSARMKAAIAAMQSRGIKVGSRGADIYWCMLGALIRMTARPCSVQTRRRSCTAAG